MPKWIQGLIQWGLGSQIDLNEAQVHSSIIELQEYIETTFSEQRKQCLRIFVVHFTV